MSSECLYTVPKDKCTHTLRVIHFIKSGVLNNNIHTHSHSKISNLADVAAPQASAFAEQQ